MCGTKARVKKKYSAKANKMLVLNTGTQFAALHVYTSVTIPESFLYLWFHLQATSLHPKFMLSKVMEKLEDSWPTGKNDTD